MVFLIVSYWKFLLLKKMPFWSIVFCYCHNDELIITFPVKAFSIIWAFLIFFKTEFLRAAQGYSTLSKICRTYATVMKLDRVIPYLKTIQKNINQGTHLLISHFWWYREIQIKNASQYIISSSFDLYLVFKGSLIKTVPILMMRAKLPTSIKKGYFEIKW